MNPVKILIAEDDNISFAYLSELLRNSNVCIIPAENGRMALDAIRRDKEIALALMDIKMPLMNGFDAAREIRNLRPDIPLIAQTAYALNEERIRILEAGFNDYISKPIRREELIRLLGKYLPGIFPQ
ncbi:MAG: response regulator [Candidatus Neomarinimicrobiota bacterium]|jgi:CheY-like chemotaxis protein|nr:response regulator [Candidatus Neomarinimicrobiota bacterium]MDD3966335.1 response regulator [Candidatus Neomarinimicrobiota bacterium]MDX9780096.1 response regulator [bacterium]